MHAVHVLSSIVDITCKHVHAIDHSVHALAPRILHYSASLIILVLRSATVDWVFVQKVYYLSFWRLWPYALCAVFHLWEGQMLSLIIIAYNVCRRVHVSVETRLMNHSSCYFLWVTLINFPNLWCSHLCYKPGSSVMYHLTKKEGSGRGHYVI